MTEFDWLQEPDRPAAGSLREITSDLGQLVWMLIKGAFFVALFALSAIWGLGLTTSNEMPPLPKGYVCAPDNMDLRCPAGQRWAETGELPASKR